MGLWCTLNSNSPIKTKLEKSLMNFLKSRQKLKYDFENTKWQDIEKNPLPYINCQWDQEQNVGSLFDPAGRYELKEGWPI
jgi:hypothetical protein